MWFCGQHTFANVTCCRSGVGVEKPRLEPHAVLFTGTDAVLAILWGGSELAWLGHVPLMELLRPLSAWWNSGDLEEGGCMKNCLSPVDLQQADSQIRQDPAWSRAKLLQELLLL